MTLTDATDDEDQGLSTAAVLGIAAAVGLVPLNSSMIAVALPKIATDFEVTTGRASTLIVVYLAVMLVGQPLAGRVGDAIGNRRIVNLALVGLTICSVIAALATTFFMLLVARMAQAVCASAITPGVQALLRTATGPEEHGRSFGLMGSVIGVGAASGPVIGGLATQAFGWRAIFLINIPIAVAALVASLRIHEPTPSAEAATRVLGGDEPVAGRIGNRIFVAAFSVQSLSTVGNYALLLLIPVMLDARGWESGPTGFVLSALTLGLIVMGPVGGRLGDRRGRRGPARTGLLVAAAALVPVLIGGRSTSVLLIVISLAVFGLGFGAATPNMTAAALESVPVHRTGAAAGVLAASRYVGSLATSIAVALFVTADAGGTRAVLVFGLISVLLAVLATSRFPDM